MKTKIRLNIKTKIVAVLFFISVVSPAILTATEPEGNRIINDGNSYNQTNLEIDSWMVDLSSWISNSKTNLTESEETFFVEKWMLRPDHQSWGDSSGEGTIQLENWMIDIQHSDWNTSQVEPELILESWMCDLRSWATS